VIEPRIWKPHQVQEEFLKIPFTVFEALYGGAAGGGKSELLLATPIVYNFHENPKFHGIVFRRTFPELEGSLIPRSREFYKPFGGEYNNAKHVWTFPSGAMMRLSHMKDVEDARSHDTAEYNYIGFDELTAFEEFQYIFLLSRARSSTAGLPAIVRAATNPGNTGHGWVKARFVSPCPSGRQLLFDPITNSKRIFIPAKVVDNPYLLANDPGYPDRLKLLPPQEQKAKLEGDWDIFAGQAFDEFREFRFPDEAAEAVHVVENFPIPHWWPRVLAIDWGSSAMTYGLWLALSPEGKVHAYREYSEKFKLTSDWSSEIGRLSFGENIVHVALDPSAWQNRGEEKNIAALFAEFSGLEPFAANNERVSGKLLIHEFLRFRQKPKRLIPAEGYQADLANRILAIQGLNAFEDYRSLFVEQVEEKNLPKLQISRQGCPLLIRTLKEAVIDEDKPNDIIEFKGDDPYDTLRYGLKAADFYFHGLLEQYEKHQKLAKIVSAFERTGDQTEYYRKMEAFESKDKVRPIAIFHKARSKRERRFA
jgi:hypothetical protein